jgi:hypothetical protein
MASESMFVLLTGRLGSCRIDGTGVRESGLVVSAETLTGETILFFHIDSPEGRQCLDLLSEGAKACDYLVFYTKNNDDKEIVCFLELKGKKLEDAIRQVLSTHQRIVILAKEEIDRKLHAYIVWKVCICLHGQAPRSGQQSVDQLIKTFGKDNVLVKHGVKHYKLLGTFLRG